MVLVGLLLGLAGWQRQGSEHQQADAAAASLADALAQDAGRAIQQFDLILQTVMGGRTSPTMADLTSAERHALLSERTPRDKYIEFVDVVGADGGVLASTRAGQEIFNWSNRDYFIAQRDTASNEPFIGRPFQTTQDDKVAIPISHRVTDRDGRFAGVVVVGVRLAYFRDRFAGLELGPRDSVTLLRTDGVILMRVPFDLNAINRSVEPDAPFSTFARDGSTPIAARDPADGVERRITFRRVEGQPLVVSVGMATHALGSWWVATAGLAIIALLGVLAYRLRQTAQQRDRAERDSREKSRFLTTLSHELRTPLHGVLGHADRLSRDGGLGPEQARQVSQIIRAARHMRGVVNIVLDYARIEALGPALHMRRIDVRRLIDSCMAVIEPGARARGLETRVTVAPQTPAWFVTDDVQLRQILVNLLSNAVKYTPQGSVELRAKGDDDRLTIEVADTGIGIPEGKRHHLFEEYERFGTERTGIEGTGLGLAIAHRLARRMGGTMGHRNAPGGGSIFWLELTAGIADEPEALPDVVAEAPKHPLNVLVVDDSEINREVAAVFLRQAGHGVVEARDGAEAVQIAAAQDFDVVLMDMRMSGLDGLEATRRIRALAGARGKVPIIAVTANALDQHAEDCRRAGMSAHLAKPFTQPELLAAVGRAARTEAPPAPAATVVDPTCVAQLAASMGEDAVRRLLDGLALRIEILLRKLEEPTPDISAGELGELAHELIGSGGTLGFTQLAAAAGRFQRALAAGNADTREMRGEAIAALGELCRGRSLEPILTC